MNNNLYVRHKTHFYKYINNLLTNKLDSNILDISYTQILAVFCAYLYSYAQENAICCAYQNSYAQVFPIFCAYHNPNTDSIDSTLVVSFEL